MNKASTYRTCKKVDWTAWFGLAVLTPLCLCQSVADNTIQASSVRAVDRVVDDWIEVTQTQCNRRLYTQAEDSLLRVQQYKQFFNEQQERKINDLHEWIEWAISERTGLLQKVDSSTRLIEEGEFLKARAYLNEAEKSEVLSDEEKNKAKLSLQRVEAKIAEQKRLMADLYKRSRREYKQGNFEKAREGFAIVASSGLYVPNMGKTAEEYLAAIEKEPVEQRNRSKYDTEWDSEVVVRHEQKTQRTQQANPPVFIGGHSSELFGNEPDQNRIDKGNIKQDYLKAVVRDAQTKVTGHIGKAEFSLAEVVVQNAQNTLQKYQADIDEELYEQYDDRLEDLLRIIDEQRMRWELRWDTKDSGL